jgi:hypothetical protein
VGKIFKFKFLGTNAVLWLFMMGAIGLYIFWLGNVYRTSGFRIDWEIFWPVAFIGVLFAGYYLVKRFGGKSSMVSGIVSTVLLIAGAGIVGVALYVVDWDALVASIKTTLAFSGFVLLGLLAARGIYRAPRSEARTSTAGQPNAGLSILDPSRSA